MNQVIFHPVNFTLAVIQVGFLLRDLLIFLPALELDFFNGGIQFFQFRRMADIRIFKLLQHGFGLFDLIADFIIMVGAQTDIQGLDAFLEVFKQFGFSGLAFKAGHLALDFDDNVIDAQQILVGFFHLAQGLDFAIFVTRGAGGFFNEIAPIQGIGFGDGPDVALLDHRI